MKAALLFGSFLEEVEQRLERLKLPDIEGWTVTRMAVTGEDAVILSGLIGYDVPRLIADLREALQRLAEWEALPTREEWAGTVSRNEPPEPGKAVFYRDAETAEKDTARNAAQLWRRKLSAHPWEPLDDDAPF